MSEPSDYLYDIFISYPHEEPHRTWVHEYFLPQFKHFVNENLPPDKKVRLYVDVEMNKFGHSWWERVKGAIACSKILIPVWSMAYFRSQWCRGEFAIMYYREQMLKFRNINNSRGLIFPIRLFSSKYFPAFTEKILYLDCSELNLVFEGYKTTEQYYKLLQLLKDGAPVVAENILNAPPWDKAWLAEPWLEDAIKAAKRSGLFAPPRKPFPPPKL